jgi:hypothetical protein
MNTAEVTQAVSHQSDCFYIERLMDRLAACVKPSMGIGKL